MGTNKGGRERDEDHFSALCIWEKGEKEGLFILRKSSGRKTADGGKKEKILSFSLHLLRSGEEKCIRTDELRGGPTGDRDSRGIGVVFAFPDSETWLGSFGLALVRKLLSVSLGVEGGESVWGGGGGSFGWRGGGEGGDVVWPSFPAVRKGEGGEGRKEMEVGAV